MSEKQNNSLKDDDQEMLSCAKAAAWAVGFFLFTLFQAAIFLNVDHKSIAGAAFSYFGILVFILLTALMTARFFTAFFNDLTGMNKKG